MATGKTDLLNRKLLYRSFSIPIGTVSGGSYTRVTLANSGYAIPTGYYPIAITYFSTGNQHLMLGYILPQLTNSSSNFILVRNGSSSSVSSITSTLRVLFAPEELVDLSNFTEADPAESSSDISSEPIFKVKSFSGSYTIDPTASPAVYQAVLSKTDCGFFIPNGYDYFGIRNVSSGGSLAALLASVNPISDSNFMRIRNTGGSSISGTASVGVTFINNKYKDHIIIESA